MKKHALPQTRTHFISKILLVMIIIAAGIFSYQYVFSKKDGIQKQSIGMQQNNERINKNNCLSDECLMVQDLTYPVGHLPNSVVQSLYEAITDEYKARATYEAVLNKFGTTRPFSMIKGAEEQHIASLKAIYDKYGIQPPTDTWKGMVTAPETFEKACQIGVEAEIANAALYKEKLLPTVTDYEDITLVFINLMNASQQKHLPAFERCK